MGFFFYRQVRYVTKKLKLIKVSKLKIAIIGSGVTGILCAKHFHEIGAQIKLFSHSGELGGLAKDNLSKDVLEAKNELIENSVVRKGLVLRVHKRFLPLELNSSETSRFADLFRVVYQIDAKENIEKSRDENNELFENLDENIIESLKTSIEAYEDFDVVMDCSGEWSHPKPMGAGGALALNEKVIKEDDRVFYGKNVLEGISGIDKERNIVFVGTGKFNLLALSKFKEKFLSQKKLNLHFVCTDNIPFEEIAESEYEAFTGFNDLVESASKEYEEEINIFNQRILEWKELESHERVKRPRPAEPVMRLSIYNGAVVSSVDKLLDRDGLFITLEGSELLGSFDKLMTIGCDKIFVDNGQFSEPNYECLLQDAEKGFFKVSDREKIAQTEKELMKLFSKQES